MLQTRTFRGALLLAGLAAACSSQTRLIVEVDATGDETVDEVRLYVATGAGVNKTLTPAVRRGTMRSAIEGKAFVVDLPADSERRHPVSADRVMSFGFAEGDAPSDHLTVLAVGFSGGEAVAYGMAFDLDIVPDEIRVATIPLFPAEAGRKRNLQVWGPNAGDDTCAVAQLDETHSLFMISSANDVDCDGVEADRECDEHVHLAGADASPGELQPTAIPSPSDGTCRIPVAATCVDGAPADVTPAAYCTTPDVCQLCESNPFFCVNTTQSARCEVAYNESDNTFCGTQMSLPLEFLLSMSTCTGPATLYVDDAPHWVGSRAIIDDGTTFATATVHTDACNVALSVDGSVSVGSNAGLTLAMPVSSPGASGIVLQVALTYEPVPDCNAAQTECVFDDEQVIDIETAYRQCLGQQ